jgi:hypothetical protein
MQQRELEALLEHTDATVGNKAIGGMCCCSSGNRSLLGHIVTVVGTEVIVGSQQCLPITLQQ